MPKLIPEVSLVEQARGLFERGRLGPAVELLSRAGGGPRRLPLDLFGSYFPEDDGRQDLVDWVVVREEQLRPHRAAFLQARRAVLKAVGPARDAEGAVYLAYCDLILGNHQRALEECEAAVRSMPSSFWLHLLHAICLRLKAAKERSRDLLPQVLGAVERAMSHDPRNPYAYFMRSSVRREFEDQDGRLADAEMLLRLRPNFAWASVEKAEILGETKRYREALVVLNGLVRKFPRTSWAWAQRARIHAITGRYALARRDFDRAVRLKPVCGGIYAWRGEMRRRAGDFRGGLADLAKAIRLDPRYRLAYSWRGRVHLLLGDPRAALADLDAALALEPCEEFAAAWRAEALWKLGRCAAAAKAFDEIYPAEPLRSWNRTTGQGRPQELGFYMGPEQGLEARAQAFWRDLDAVADARPRDAWAWAFRGQCRISAGRLDEAIADLGRAISLDPGLAYAYRWRGEAHRRAGALAPALADLDRAAGLAPADRWTAAFRALARAAVGDHRGAQVDFDRALASDEQKFSFVRLWRGEWLYAQGRIDEARRDFETARMLDTKDERAADWLKRLPAREPQTAA